MGFLDNNAVSIAVLSVAYIVLAIVFAGVVRITRGAPKRAAILGVVAVVFLVMPVSEELWIARNFGQACKDAGTFVHRKAQVAGFYDDTTGWGPRQLADSKYQFMESRDIVKRRLIRVERADDQSRDTALAWYRDRNSIKQIPKDTFVVQPVNDTRQVVVSPNGLDAWHVITIERATARYHFKKLHEHTKVAHGVTKQEWVIADTQTGDQIARETAYARAPSWQFLAAHRATVFCPVSGKHGEKLVATLHRMVLEPEQR